MTSRRSMLLPLVVLSLPLLLSTFAPVATGQVNVKGQWTTQSVTMPINPVHAALMQQRENSNCCRLRKLSPLTVRMSLGPPYGVSNARALAFTILRRDITQLTLSWDMFCNGMVVLPDGRPFINSGTVAIRSISWVPQVRYFRSGTNTFTDVQNMVHGRWYPTLTTLGDGRVMTFSGLDGERRHQHHGRNLYRWIGLEPQYFAGWTPPLYPRMHLLPNGKVFYSGQGTTFGALQPGEHYLDHECRYNKVLRGQRSYGTSVLLPLTPANNYNPKVMIMGGNSPATATTEIIDLGAIAAKVEVRTQHVAGANRDECGHSAQGQSPGAGRLSE